VALPRAAVRIVAGGLAVAAMPARAACDLPQELADSPAAAARFLLREAELVGIVAVVREADDGDVLDVIIPFKGPRGRVALERERADRAIVITNASVSLGLPAGSVGFAALARVQGRLVISECTSALLIHHSPASLAREAYRISPSD
jgi:hypothetical protein